MPRMITTIIMIIVAGELVELEDEGVVTGSPSSVITVVVEEFMAVGAPPESVELVTVVVLGLPGEVTVEPVVALVVEVVLPETFDLLDIYTLELPRPAAPSSGRMQTVL